MFRVTRANAELLRPDQRVRRRRTPRPERIRVLAYCLEAFICFAVLGSIAYAFSGYIVESERLQVKRVLIDGARVLSPEVIRDAAGITADDNLLFFSPSTVEERIRGLSYVKACTVRRAFPDTVIIDIEERASVATLLVHGQAWEIDENGTVLRRLDPLAPQTGPLITNVPGLGAIEEGQTLDNATLHAAIEVWRAFSLQPISQEVLLSEIAAPSENAISMFADGLPYEVRWGRTDFERQARLLDLLWRRKQGVLPCEEYLDLRFDNDVVCK